MPASAPFTDVYDLVPPLPPGVKDLRDAALFTEHPLKNTYKSARSGEQLPVEFHAYNADNTTIVCLADLYEVTQYLAPLGYKPVTIPDPHASLPSDLASDTREKYAIINLAMNDYKDTSAGPYQAFPLCIFATEDVATNLEWHDPTSALLPLLDSGITMVMGPLAMSRNIPAYDVGREQMGIDKFITDARISHDIAGTSASITHKNSEVLRVRVNDATPEQAFLSGLALFKNLGILGSLQMLIGTGQPVVHPFVGWGGTTANLSPAHSVSYTITQPKFKAWDPAIDVFQPQPGCPLTDLLLQFKATPILSSRDPQISVAVEHDEKSTHSLVSHTRLYRAPAYHRVPLPAPVVQAGQGLIAPDLIDSDPAVQAPGGSGPDPTARGQGTNKYFS
jgi:hypothetical protein